MPSLGLTVLTRGISDDTAMANINLPPEVVETLKRYKKGEAEKEMKEVERVRNLKYRVIVRLSNNNEGAATKHTVKLKKILERAGFTNLGTGEHEARGLTIQKVADVFNDLWQAIPIPANPKVHLDHFWTYTSIDHAD